MAASGQVLPFTNTAAMSEPECIADVNGERRTFVVLVAELQEGLEHRSHPSVPIFPAPRASGLVLKQERSC